MRILVISFRFPYPLTDGSRIRIYNLSKILAHKHRVDLLTLNEGKIARDHLERLGCIFGNIYSFPFHRMRFTVNTLRGVISGDPLQVHYYYFRKVQRWLEQQYAKYDLIFCFHIRMARYVRHIVDRPKIIDLIDATSMNYLEAQRFAKGLWRFIYPMENRRLLSYELRMLELFDKAFITSHYDKVYLESNARRSLNNLVVIPNGVREDLLTRTPVDEEQDWIVFLGRMAYAPNVDAVTYFANEVFPLIRQKENVKFIIVGTEPTKEVLKLKNINGVEVTGFVEDPYQYLERAKVVVAPLRFSAGIQNKILEAMALRRSVVTTSKGARGIAGRDGEHFLVADEPVRMAEKVLQLLRNPELRREIGENARRLVEDTYRWHVIGEKLLAEVDALLNQ